GSGGEGGPPPAEIAGRPGGQRQAAVRDLCRARHYGCGKDDSADQQSRRRRAVFRRRVGAGLATASARRVMSPALSGRLAVIGLGPGDPRYLTAEAATALADAQALYGYGPYLDRVPAR